VILYLDTSAVVKLYAIEPGGTKTHWLVSAASLVVSSLITYVETRSALARKYHSGEIVVAAFETAKAEFEADWRIFSKIAPDSAIVRRAGDLAEQFRLRAYDSVHLATAELVFLETRAELRFACFDAALNRAASSLGLAVG
jgi:uncharacterized protein